MSQVIPKKKKDKIIYISNELHKKIKLYCLKNEIGAMKDFVEPFLTAAVEKPKAKERLEKAAEELSEEDRKLIDAETNEVREAALSEEIPGGQIKVL